MLVSIAVAALMPLPSHDRTAPEGCHESAIPVAAVTANGAPGSDCGHGPGNACATMVGCITVPPALAPSRARLTTIPVFGTLGSVAATRLYGRLALGPPTPPPNS
jgi:hypothetical protein